MRLVIIGNGMAATRLIESLTERAPGRFIITVIGEEAEPAYNRIQLSPVLGGEKQAAATRFHDDAWYQARGVTVMTGERVTAVDLAAREIHTAQRSVRWDELVFATGSQPFIPPVSGSDGANVFTFRTLKDVDTILAATGPVVVLGGGVLGVEAAAALRHSCDNVTIVHRGPWLMEQQLDQQTGALLEQALKERGIDCELASGITNITSHTVTLSDGRTRAATRVVLATGVVPNASLAKASGLLCAKGIVVDSLMQTSHPASSAIGECSEINGQTWGLVAPCLAQADILAARLAGKICAAFTPCDSGMRLKVTGMSCSAPVA
ncbi:assimilatory nitrite reductase (NAD(P)H) large subunit / assimilatory nitrite reductase (NAD(P)H)small subunit / assimilatory nitrate reductase (NADH) beta subunit [Lelliottia amnigena]|nr:assimilatory nitrite reductase (NAD(P)H) large subunit / assimilatory nitrite reductase (NAD(P)H)small subunit / assimilatory nitrate reductase (NADH) beta subunit [Lelliottia amnigena]